MRTSPAPLRDGSRACHYSRAHLPHEALAIKRCLSYLCAGRDHLRLVEIDGVELDAVPRGHLLFIKNEDTLGVIGQMGTLLGARQVNIARMSVGRKGGSKRAVMILEVDSEVPGMPWTSSSRWPACTR